MTIKAMRAANWDPKKVKFPVLAEPKIDGVRAINMDGTLTGRSLKKHRNKYVTTLFSKPEYIGFDGELAAAHECNPALCRLTSSVVSRIEGEPYVLWHIFDYVTDETRHLSYRMRRMHLITKIEQLQKAGLAARLRVVPVTVCNNMEELDLAHQNHMALGYEGTCFYGPDVKHKEGKSSPTHNGVLRIKDFIDSEAIVTGLIEGETNNNEAQINELGNSFRTSHQENKVPNGMVGSLICRSLVDVFDLYETTRLLIAKDSIFTVSPGAMTHDERIAYLADPTLIVGKTIIQRFFPKGIKDKPRFSNFVSIRSVEDMD